MMIALENMYRYSVDCRSETELLYFEWSPPWYIYIYIILTFYLAFYLTYILTFYLACVRVQACPAACRARQGGGGGSSCTFESRDPHLAGLAVNFHKTKANMGILR
jgi:hypothetical protein